MTKIQELIENADNAYYAAEHDKAVRLYKQALELDPNNAHAQQQLRKAEANEKLMENADNAYYSTEYDKAIQLYMQVLDLDVDNKRAQEQLRKAERNRFSKITKPGTVSTKALQFYMRSRSFIAAGDLAEARRLLKQAIDVAEKAGADFPDARNLLGNIQNALKAEEFKARAHNEIAAGQWARAADDLNSALNLDPTDDAIGILLSHLRSLLKAQNLINNLNAGNVEIGSRSTVIREIRKTIKLTNETTELSKLWQDVENLFGEYNNKNMVFRNRNMVFRWIMLVVLSMSVILLITFGFLYLFPRHRGVKIKCDNIAPDLRAELDYPYYIANGDEDKIEIMFINDSSSIVDDVIVEVEFNGTAHLKYVDPLNSNEIKLDEIYSGHNQPVTIPFFVDGSTSTIPGPWYINFSVGTCTPKDFHIAMTPISSLRKLVVGLWGILVASLIGLFKDRIKELFEWLWSFFQRVPDSEVKPKEPPTSSG